MSRPLSTAESCVTSPERLLFSPVAPFLPTMCPTISGQELMLAVSCLTPWGEGLLNDPNAEGEGLLGDGDWFSLRPGERRKLSKSPKRTAREFKNQIK